MPFLQALSTQKMTARLPGRPVRCITAQTQPSLCEATPAPGVRSSERKSAMVEEAGEARATLKWAKDE